MGNLESSSINNTCISINGTLSTLTWSFLDYTGFHQIVLLHDIFSGSRIIYHNKKEILNIPSILIDNGSVHTFIFPEVKRLKSDSLVDCDFTNDLTFNPIENHATPIKISIIIENESLQFNYRLLINNINVIDHNRKIWNHLIYWQFTIDEVLFLFLKYF